MKQWEYLVVEVTNPTQHKYGDPSQPRPTPYKINGEQMKGMEWIADNIHVELNKLGKEGWELIKIGRGNSENHSLMYTFKRQL